MNDNRPLNTTQLIVNQDDTILDFLSLQFPKRNRNKLKTWLKHKSVTVNESAVTQYDAPVHAGDVVVIFWKHGQHKSALSGIKIVFEDEYLLVIDKPAGLLSVASDKVGHSAFSIMLEYVRKQQPSAGLFVVHRLDRDTSGVMLFAKSSEVQRQLQEHWSSAVVERRYVALTTGPKPKPAGTIRSYLAENKALQMYSTTSDKGKLAITHYKTISYAAPYSLLEVWLETGRKNQIRVHLSDIGQQIVGDRKYGTATGGQRRLCLHAWVLTLVHPINGTTMRFETEVPRELTGILK